MCKGQNITPRSRREALAKIRGLLLFTMVETFSDRCKDHQKVKWYGIFHANFPIQELVIRIGQILWDYGYADVDVSWGRNGNGVESIILRFPHKWYY